MSRLGFALLWILILGCGGKEKGEKATDEKGFSYDSFAEGFKELSLPYELSDQQLLKNKDTAGIRGAGFTGMIPDSLRNKWFGKGSKVRYVAMGKIRTGKPFDYYVVKATSGAKKAALLFSFNHDRYGGVIPLLLPDNDPATTQVSLIDKSNSIQKNITLRKSDNTTLEGKEVYEYYPDQNQFALILTNPINTGDRAIINPIDTLPRKHKFSGDYVRDKMNFVSVRDGRTPSQLRVFVHFKNQDDCSGELKGDLLLTSGTTAIYREGGDPCILSFQFTGNSVTMKEQEGCGSHRDLDCAFDGTYTKKKSSKAKPAAKKK